MNLSLAQQLFCYNFRSYFMKQSAGLLMFRRRNDNLEFFLVHPGGPFFKKKDEGFWTIPKGEPNPNEPMLDAAKREFKEETGIDPVGPFIELGSIKQKGGKVVYGWAFEKNISSKLISNYFDLEWPPRSGKMLSFPEVDRGEYFVLNEAKTKINEAQIDFLLRLIDYLSINYTINR